MHMCMHGAMQVCTLSETLTPTYMHNPTPGMGKKKRVLVEKVPAGSPWLLGVFSFLRRASTLTLAAQVYQHQMRINDPSTV